MYNSTSNGTEHGLYMNEVLDQRALESSTNCIYYKVVALR